MRRQTVSRRTAAGFSLIELMLALALGIVVVTGIVQLFVGNSQTYNVLNGQARLQESGRFALDFISRAARSAGYFGCAYEQRNLVPALNGALDAMPEFNVQRIVQGYEATGAGWTPALTSLPTALNAYVPGTAVPTATIESGTDVLVVRAMQRPGQNLTAVLQPTGDPQITAPGGDPGFAVNDIVMVADCEQAAVFKVTGIAAVGANEVRLAHATAAGLHDNSNAIPLPAGGTSPFTLSLLGHSYSEDATVGRIETTVFYIAPGNGLDDQGNPPLALWQKVGSAAPVELVQGVENLQILYGLDTTLADRTSNANRYVTFNNLPDPNDSSDVVSLRVSVTVNSVDAVADGNTLRRTFSKTILLRNANPEAV